MLQISAKRENMETKNNWQLHKHYNIVFEDKDIPKDNTLF